MVAGGNSLRRDYTEFAGSSHLREISPHQHPYLVGFTPMEAAQKDGTQVATIQAKSFLPRFHFRPGQKKILLEALRGETDEGIAETLGISLWTIKKRWQAIYDKVLEKDPDLLTENMSKGPKKVGSEAGKSKQRRRFLLEYLRHHPEEIGPPATLRSTGKK